MKTNANDPIKPVILRQIGESDFKLASEKDLKEGIYLSSKMGLSKLEHFSAMAMQGLLSNSIDKNQGVQPFYDMSYQALAHHAVKYAQALINELNKVEP